VKRYTIIGRQYGANNEREIAQCDTNPQEVVDGAMRKIIKGKDGRGKTLKLPMYEHVYFVDNVTGGGRRLT
jgi:hypothetical protein